MHECHKDVRRVVTVGTKGGKPTMTKSNGADGAASKDAMQSAYIADAVNKAINKASLNLFRAPKKSVVIDALLSLIALDMCEEGSITEEEVMRRMEHVGQRFGAITRSVYERKGGTISPENDGTLLIIKGGDADPQ
jgi:hypothetical protein